MDPIIQAELQLQLQTLQNTAPYKEKYRRCCCCVAGPSGAYTKFIVTFLISLGLVGALFSLQSLDPSEEPTYETPRFITMVVLTGMTLLSMTYVGLSDPGFIDPATYDSSKAQEVKKHIDDSDLERMFQNGTTLYEPRDCNTCKITRPPLSSHCNYCNACVLKFDHHCTVLNQCIG